MFTLWAHVREELAQSAIQVLTGLLLHTRQRRLGLPQDCVDLKAAVLARPIPADCFAREPLAFASNHRRPAIAMAPRQW